MWCKMFGDAAVLMFEYEGKINMVINYSYLN